MAIYFPSQLTVLAQNFSEKILCKHNQQDTASPRADARPAAADCVQKRRAIAEGFR
ncbi:MAG: hypothetical protein ACYTXI_08950 [Nostoc sp.]